MDLTVSTAVLAASTAEAVRLLPAPALGGVLLTAGADGLGVAAVAPDHALRLERPALVHTGGEALVPLRPLAETVRALDAEELRVSVEETRLVVRAPGGRFALPLLDRGLHPGIAAPPQAAGSVAGPTLRGALEAVASAASREAALPIFTGVRMWTEGGVLTLLATDRYRMALATLDWTGGRLDALAPAAALSALARGLGAAPSVGLGADSDRLGLSWGRTRSPPRYWGCRSRTSGRASSSGPSRQARSSWTPRPSSRPCAGPRPTPGRAAP